MSGKGAHAALQVFDPVGANAISEEPLYFWACATGRCEGGREFQCKPGYTGEQCSVCVKGQFFWQGKCDTACSDVEPDSSYGVSTVFGIIAVVLVWTILNKSAGGLFESLDVGIAYIQMYP